MATKILKTKDTIQNANDVPNSIETEKVVLANILIGDVSKKIAFETGLLPEDFFDEKNKIIFTTMMSMNKNNEYIDSITLTDKLKSEHLFEKIKDDNYIKSLEAFASNESSTFEYIKIIKDKALNRKAYDLASQIVKQIELGRVAKPNDVVELFEESANEITKNSFASDFDDTSLKMKEYIEYVKRVQNGDIKAGVKTNYVDLDKITNGLHGGDLIILAARPSVGKTAFALNLALNCSKTLKNSNEAVVIFSLEMGTEQLFQRMISAESRVEGNKIRTGDLTNEDWNKIIKASKTIVDNNIVIDDTAGIKVSDIYAKCKKLQSKQKIGLIVIDYIQLITGNKTESRQVEISEISRSLKLLARDLDVPVVALSQLSRSVEKREDKRPMLSDLRESGAIEQDADIVMFLYRDAYYNRELAEQNDQIVELNLAKHRNGATGEIKLSFSKNINAFYTVIDDPFF